MRGSTPSFTMAGEETTEMAKTSSSGSGRRTGAVRDRSDGPAKGKTLKPDAKATHSVSEKGASVAKSERRVILFPTEPSTIGRKKIEQAIEFVISQRKK
jgi:hypothetical protein